MMHFINKAQVHRKLITSTYNDYLYKNRERKACQLVGFWLQSQVKSKMDSAVYLFICFSNRKEVLEKRGEAVAKPWP